MEIINVTDHDLNFWSPQTGDEFVVPPCGVVISAKRQQTELTRDGVTFINTRYVPQEKDQKAIDWLITQHPGAILVGSVIAAKVYPKHIVSVIDAPGSNRRGRIYCAYADKFNIEVPQQ